MRYAFRPAAEDALDNVRSRWSGGCLLPRPGGSESVTVPLVELTPTAPLGPTPIVRALTMCRAMRCVGRDWADKGATLRFLGHAPEDLTVVRSAYPRAAWDAGDAGHHRRDG